MRCLATLAAAALLAGLAACASPPGTAPAEAAMQAEPGRHLVLAVDNPLAPAAGPAGASLGSYGPVPRYLQGQRAASVLAEIAHTHGLQVVAGWPIAALGWQCVVVALPPGHPREATLAALAADPRVRLAQPLNEFDTLAGPTAAPSAQATAAPAPPAPPALAYNDPYLPLQRGFAELAAAQAHRVSAGAGVRVAVVDTGAATRHPDLLGRVASTQDFVGPAAAFEGDHHGTQVAGVIAATANNHQGIVGIAPQATLALHKACWPRADAPGGAARCNSFTLAQALAAVLASDARVVNLSLGGPADPLLARLLDALLAQGRIVVGALPPGGQRGGFPTGTPGVLAVGSAGTTAPAHGLLLAPGQDVLTLQPGASYGYASGSSLAAAHVSGVAALLLAAEPRLPPERLRHLLATSPGPVNAHQLLDALGPRSGAAP